MPAVNVSNRTNGICHHFVGGSYHGYVEDIPILGLNGIDGVEIMVQKAIDSLSQRAEKEARLGVERTARIHRWSFDHGGIYPTSMASIQAEECS